MKIKAFINLKKIFDDRSFETRYGITDKLLYTFSWIGNVASIFLAYWFLSDLLYRIVSDFTGRVTIITLSSIIVLTIFELLKRFVLKILSLSVIQSKNIFNTEILYNLFFTIILVAGSFYLSLSGAKVFADKQEKIEQVTELNISNKTDSINILFDEKLKYKIDERDNLRKSRDIYNEKIKNATYSSRLKEYNNLIKQANEELKRIDGDIDQLKVENKTTIEDIKNKIQTTSVTQIIKVKKNQIIFICISCFIELLILVGIWFHSVFNLKVYQEYKHNIRNSQNFKLYEDYRKMLSLLFQNGKVDYEHELPSLNSFKILLRKREDFSMSYTQDFLDMCKSLGIIVINSKRKVIAAKKYEEAETMLIEYFEKS